MLGVILRVSAVEFQGHPSKAISCDGTNEYFSMDIVHPKHCRYAAIWKV
jgi:hypothetical protein